MTTVTVAEGPAFVFVAVDHCTAECIGLHAAKRGTRFEALEPIRQGIRERFGGIGEGVARLRLRHDHGSNYLADDFQQRVLRHRKFPELRAGARRQRRRGALHSHAEGESGGCGASRHRGTPPGLACVQADIQRTVWRNTTIEAPPRCDATSSGWTRQRRSEYRQTTVQEPWGLHSPVDAV